MTNEERNDREIKRAMRKARLSAWLETSGKAFFTGATIGAAWLGWIAYIQNAYQDVKIKRLEERTDRIGQCINNHADVIEHNAHCSQHDRDQLREMQSQVNTLLGRALEQTEGKAS